MGDRVQRHREKEQAEEFLFFLAGGDLGREAGEGGSRHDANIRNI